MHLVSRLYRSRRFASRTLAVLLVGALLRLTAAGQAVPDYVEGEVIVTFKATATLASATATLNKRSLGFTRHFAWLSGKRQRQTGLVRHAAKTTATLIADLKNDPDVETVEPNYLRYVSTTPNDTRFAEMWALQNTGQSVNSTTGTAGADAKFLPARAMARTINPAQVVVAVVDTGVDFVHPDLAANMWVNSGEIAGNGVDDDGNNYVDDVNGFDFVGSTGAPSDSGSHGTHVAGTIAAAGNNALGTIGVNERAQIMACKVSSDGSTISTAAEITALQYIAQMKSRGVNIVAVNASYGGGSSSTSESAAIQALSEVGILFCAAAGNSSANNDTTADYPGNYRLANMIVVAATDQNDALASYSNYGATMVDIAAPGSNILSTQPSKVTFQAGGTTYATATFTYTGLTPGVSGNLVDCGIGNPADFPAAVSGNIALIARGTLTFATKAANAKAAGAIAVIIYNNTTGTINGTLGGAGAWLPVYAISQADGLAIKASLPKTGTLSITGNYQFLNGTSMATPHVTGAAALAGTNNPEETMAQRRQRILAAVDVKAGLSGKVATGGRLNLLRVVDGNQDGVADWYELLRSLSPALTTASPLANGFVNATYSQTFATAGGTAPYAYAISGGTLPAGLSLSSAGVLSGTPTAGGIFSFTVQATDAVALTAQSAYSLTIQTPLSLWTAAQFTEAEQADATISGALADPNHNGLPNLLEYALSRDPKAANFSPPLGSSWRTNNGSTYLTVSYTRLLGAAGVSYTVEVSQDLLTWNSGSLYTQEVSAVDDGNGITQTVTVQMLLPLSGTPHLFTRLRVTQP
jgi:subtilisin family serine protease